MTDLNKLISDAKIAIEFWEDIDAKKILKQLRVFIAENKIEQVDPVLFAKLQKWIVYLQLVAFPNLSDQECGEILKNHYLEAFRINVPMENRISGKLFLFPYLVRDEVREVLKRGLVENAERLGMQTIGQWIQEFEKEFNVHSRTESAPVQFVRENPKASTLSPTEQHILKETLHVYDYLLVSNLPAEGEDLHNLMESGALEKETGSYGQQAFSKGRSNERSNSVYAQNSGKTASGVTQKKLISIPLLEALGQFSNLGEQVITSNPLKLRYFPTPVKSSIKNWITDYHDVLGAGKHETMDRGNYLFHSENGKKLTPFERQKVSMLLKSLDEGMPLEIDGDGQKIIFSAPVETPSRESKSVPTFQNSSIERIEKPINRNGNYDSNVNSQEEVANSRIRQSLDFSNFQNSQIIKKENPARKVFDFEDSDYASRMREKISANPEPKKDLDNYFGVSGAAEVQKPAVGSLRFSSAQELPAEKRQDNYGQNFAKPQIQVEPTGNVRNWNSPDFKSQISQGNSMQTGQAQSTQGSVQQNLQRERPTSEPGQAYPSHFIRPVRSYTLNGNVDNSAAASQNDPKIKGNVVDLS